MTGIAKREIKKTYFRYIVSSVAAMWVFTIYTMVDGMFVARGVGSTALAAVNISMPFINVAFALGILFAIGASTKASIYRGRGDGDKANRAFTSSTITVFGLSLLIAVFGLLNLERIALLLGATEETADYVKDYLGIILLFVPCYMTGYHLEVLLKADGYPQKAIFVALAGALTNIVLDYFFVMIFHWGIKGAAIATGASQLLTLIIFVSHFLSRKATFRFVKTRWSLRNNLSMAKLGVSDFVTEFSIGAIIFLFNNTLIRVSGNDGVVIYTVISYVSQLILMTMMGLNQGMQPLVSYYHGKEEAGVHRYILKITLLCAGIASAVAFVWGVLYPNPVVAVFIDRTAEAALYERGVEAFKLFSFSFLPLGFVVTIMGYFTALEQSKPAMAISICRGLVFVCISLLVMTLLFGETGVWLSMTISETVALVLAMTLYRRKLKTGLGKSA